MTVKTLNELLASFAANQNQHVRLRDLRDFVESRNVFEPESFSVDGQITQESDVALVVPGASNITLPDITDYGRRQLSVINASGATITVLPDGSSTLDGNASETLDDEQFMLLYPDADDDNWLLLVRTVAPDPAPFQEHVFAYWEDNPNFTAVGGGYTVIDGTFSSGATNGFTVGANTITYNGSGGLFAFDLNLSGMKESAGGQRFDANIAFFINGSIIPPKMTQTFNKTEDSELSLSGIVVLSTNDVIDVRVDNLDNTRDPNIVDLNLKFVQVLT